MGRGKARGRKLARTSGDHGSSEEERMPARKRRGRPQKSFREEMEEDEILKIEEDENGEEISVLQVRDASHKARAANEKAKNEEKAEGNGEENENGVGLKSGTEEELGKGSGFRQSSGRRKSKPRRAAEAVVECN